MFMVKTLRQDGNKLANYVDKESFVLFFTGE